MINILSSHLPLLLTGQYAVHMKLEITSSEGDNGTFYRDIVSLANMDPLISAEWGVTIDESCASGEIRIAAWDTMRGISLSPFMLTSPFNLGSTDGPALRPGRYFRLFISLSSLNNGPGEWSLCFMGRIDNVIIDNEDIVLQVRGPECSQMDKWIGVNSEFGGDTVLGTMNQIVGLYGAANNPFGNFSYNSIQAGLGGVAPTIIPLYIQEIMPVMEALERLKLLIGWDVRVFIEGNNTFSWKLYDPEVTLGGPLWTFQSGSYMNVENMIINGDDVRNLGKLRYNNGLEVGPIFNLESISKYHIRPLWLFEDMSSPIDTAPEATEMLQRAINYLSEPMASFGMKVPFFWPVELNDLYRFEANGFHFSSDQDFFVSGYRHVLQNGSGETTLQTRVRPAAAWRQYLGSLPVNVMIDIIPPVDGVNFAAEDTLWCQIDPIV